VAASKDPEHPRDWRPQLFVFSDDTERRQQLLRFASWITGKSGTATLVHMIEGEGIRFFKKRKEVEAEMLGDIKQVDPSIFPLALVTPDLNTGVAHLLQSAGIGPLKANTILLNWFEKIPTELERWREYYYSRNLRTVFYLGCNTIILAAKINAKLMKDKEPQRIDIWWWDDATSHLMLMLAYLLTRNDEWEHVKIRVIGMNYEEPSQKNMDILDHVLKDKRIEATPYLPDKKDLDYLCQCSTDAVLTFVPFRLKGDQIFDLLGNKIDEMFLRIHRVVLVMASEDLELDAEPEEGKASEIAELLDTFQDSQKKAETAEKEAEKAAEELTEARSNLQKLMADGSAVQDKEMRSKIENKIQNAENKAEKSIRKAAKAAAKLETATKEAKEHGVQIDPPDTEE
jgi:hypothetical protein